MLTLSLSCSHYSPMVIKPTLSPHSIQPEARGIVRTLQDHGHKAYLVGGCVRDLLVGITPKDFDIATSARPNQVRRLIHNAYVIGKRFRLVLVKRGDLQLEVATFRREVRESDRPEDIPEGDNIFGSPQEDANRRDFTINGLFYDPVKDKLIDYCGGLKDLEAQTLRMIGDPAKRLIEDSIRILRGIRLAHKLNFSIEENLRYHLEKQAMSLRDSALPRRREEFLKLLQLKDPSMAFIEAYDLGVLKEIAPHIHEAMENELFVNELRCFHRFYREPKSLTLFGLLIHAYYYYCMGGMDRESIPHANEIMVNEKLSTLMKEELGMFKYEQLFSVKSIQMQRILSQRRLWERKGGERLLAVVQSEAYPLAVEFAKVALNIAPQDLLFWENLYESHKDTIKSRQSRSRRSRRTTHRRVASAKKKRASQP